MALLYAPVRLFHPSPGDIILASDALAGHVFAAKNEDFAIAQSNDGGYQCSYDIGPSWCDGDMLISR